MEQMLFTQLLKVFKPETLETGKLERKYSNLFGYQRLFGYIFTKANGTVIPLGTNFPEVESWCNTHVLNNETEYA